MLVLALSDSGRVARLMSVVGVPWGGAGEGVGWEGVGEHGVEWVMGVIEVARAGG